jgi:hypothetical protein
MIYTYLVNYMMVCLKIKNNYFFCKMREEQVRRYHEREEEAA